MIKRLSFTLLGFMLGMPVLKAQGPLDCGKYSIATTKQGQVCHRVGILPWFVGIPGVWDTELRLGVAGDTVRFSFVSSLSLNYYDANLIVEDSEFGSTSFEALSEMDLPKYGSHWTRILGACHALAGQCPTVSATGSMIVTAEAPSAAALDAVSAFGVYTNSSNGKVVSQATAPLIFQDQAAARWSANIMETPLDRRSQPGAPTTTFAVANLSPDSQAVLIRVYDERGNLAASGATPVLGQALGFSGANDVLVGGVYADTLANVLGVNLPSSYCSGCANATVFRGTVVLEGEKGGLIAPVVFRVTGSVLTAVPVIASR